MSSSIKQVILFLGGAGAQVTAIAKQFSATNNYDIRILTRSLESPQAKEVGAVANVTVIEGDTYDEDSLVKAIEGVELVFVNTNGFAVGESKEIYWGIRIYEIARWAGVKHFVYSALPYVTQNGSFDPKRRVPFVDGKGKVVQYLKSMPTAPMNWTVLSSGPYAERLWDSGAPTKDENGVYIFDLPLGPTGAMPLVSLVDMARYAIWIFEKPKLSAGLELGVAIAPITGAEIVAAFERVTGKKARWNDIPLEEMMKRMPQGKLGQTDNTGLDDPTNKTAADHFRPWFNIFRDSGGNKGPWKRDYEILDQILPDRIRTIDEWMRSVNYDGERKQILRTVLTSYTA